MASLGALSFFLETPNEKLKLPPFQNRGRDSRLLLHRRPSFSVSYNRENNVLDPSNITCCCNFLGSRSGIFLVLFSSGGRKCVGAVERSGGVPEGSSGDDGDDVVGVEDDDELKAAIEKSKKVLAVQKDLLQQIVERRKLVSSLKDGAINTEMDASTSANEGDRSLSDFDLAFGSASFDGENKKSSSDITASEQVTSRIPLSENSADEENESTDKSLAESSAADDKALSSESFDGGLKKTSFDIYARSASISKQDTSRVPLGENSVEEEKESVDKSQFESSVADALGLSRESSSLDSETIKSRTMPSVLPKASKPSEEKQDEKSIEFPEKNLLEESDVQDAAPEEGNANSPPLAGVNVMNVILVAAECAPWSKTGGLGDVAGALPKALARRGHRVMVVAPRYGNYSEPQEVGTRKRYKVHGQDMEVTYYHAYIDGVDFVFIDSPIFSHRENNIYGGERQDILKRMVLFCKAAVEVPWHVPCGGACYGDGNLVFIANDWHTALLPVYLKAYYRDNGLMTYTRSVLVIHNIAHQGRGPVDDFNIVDLPGHYIDLFKLYDPVGGEHFNIFAAGLKTADRIVTVSHGYMRELKTSGGGWGLHEIINESNWKLDGIVNGIDTKDWNPKLDVHLKSDGYTNYSLETLKTGKAQCKAALQKELGLPVRSEVPLIGFIGRLDHQKGVDLIAQAIPWKVSQDMQLVMLGTGRADLEEMLRKFERQYHDKVRGWVGFSVKTAHRITAGADILLMPSRFEPCGLNQLYAMMYGTVPVVHAVGGLRDTVQPFDPFNERGLGWTFDRAESNKLIDALGHCLNTYWNYKNSWEGLQRRGMTQDISWDNAAQHYEDVLVKAKYQW